MTPPPIAHSSHTELIGYLAGHLSPCQLLNTLSNCIGDLLIHSSVLLRCVRALEARAGFPGYFLLNGFESFVKIVAIIAALVIIHVCARCHNDRERIRCSLLGGIRCLGDIWLGRNIFHRSFMG